MLVYVTTATQQTSFAVLISGQPWVNSALYHPSRGKWVSCSGSSNTDLSLVVEDDGRLQSESHGPSWLAWSEVGSHLALFYIY